MPLYVNVGRAKNDGTYHIYDITKKLRDTANRINGLERPKPNEGYALENDVSNNSIPDSTEKINPQSKNSSEPTSEITRKVFKLASKVEGYAKLNENNKRTVRGVMRQALAHGVSEDVAVDIASVAARSGAKIRFNKEACRVTKKDGTIAYANGKYSKTTDTITLNPDAKNKIDVILLHELLHNMIAAKSGKRTYAKLAKRAKASMPEADRKTLEDRYASYNITDGKVIAEEITTHYGETLTNRAFIKALVAEDASIIERIVDFFTKAKSDYAGSEKLSRSAKKFLRAYKKMFAEFSAQNQNTNAYGEAVKWKVNGEASGATSTDVDTDTRFALPYDDVIEKLENGTLDTSQNTHLRVLEHTPQIYIDKAGASDREIVMSWDVAYLAMNKNGTIPGNYHGLGAEVMKALPAALEDPLYIVKQKNGRIAAVTKIVVKGKRAVFASIELEAYQTTIQEGETEAKKYNLVVTVTDAKPNYLQNTIFSGEIVHNKNSEDPANFILRLKSLEKAVPTYDLAGSSDNSITENAEKINPSDKNSSDRLSLPDEEYLTAVEKGDMVTAQRMVDEAAKTAGYTDKLYHGTHQFGFTEFDPAFSDDKISIFVAGNDELAQTYSGRYGARKISDTYKLDGLTIEEVVKKLNKESNESYEGRELKTEYEIMHLSDVNKLIDEVNLGIEELQETVEVKIKEYADRMAKDFNDKDQRTHSKLIELNEALEYYRYEQMSTPIYVLLHYTDAFNGSKDIAELEYKIRLMNKLTHADTRDGIIVKKDLDGYGISLLYFDEARAELKSLRSAGNYALYGKPTGQLVIDGKGQVWNNIRNWVKSVYYTQEGTTAERKGDYFRLYDNKSGNEIFHGRIAVNETNANMSIDYLKPIMVQKANNVLAIRAEYMHTTRDIARFAKDNGYESVKFENIEDNGGNGKSVGAGDVYAYFNPNNLKSADPVTYDENGKIIPLSKRFNADERDIRYSLPDDYDTSIANLTEKQYNSFGWVRANDVLSADAYKNFTSEFAKALNSKEYAKYKTSSGEYMIAVGERYGATEGVKNYIVYAKGTIEMPEITRIIFINEYEETKLSEIRRDLYETERRGIQQKTEGIFRRHNSFDFRGNVHSQRNIRKMQGHNNQLGTQRGGSGKTTKRVVGFHEVEDGLTEYVYSDGTTERLSLPDEDVNSPTLENVAKEREQYKPGPKDKFITAWDNFQIEAVDETYGIQKYLIKNGGEARADVEALVQLARASRVRANEMIGSSQYDLFTQKKLGDGLEVIYKPINDKGEEYVGKFEDYLLHLLNIDRMTLHERTQAVTAEESRKIVERYSIIHPGKKKEMQIFCISFGFHNVQLRLKRWIRLFRRFF